MKKKILLVIGCIIIACVVGFVYLIVSDLKQEDLLKQEVVNLSNKDLLKDNYDIEVKTTGDYAYIEEAIKKFYKNLSEHMKTLNYYLTDEELIGILSADNLEKDGPKFEKSYSILEEARRKSNEAIQNIVALCDEDAIKNLIDAEKVDDYYIDLYKKLMYTEQDLQYFEETKEDMEVIATNLNLFLDKVKEILEMLERNGNSWVISNGQIYFETDALVEEYNRLYTELEQFVSEKLDTNQKAGTTRPHSSV